MTALRQFRSLRAVAITLALLVTGLPLLHAADYPAPKDGTAIIKNFRFGSGEVLPELKLHYITVGEATGEPVLILHGTGGSARGLLSPGFAGELFGQGQPLDAGWHEKTAGGFAHGRRVAHHGDLPVNRVAGAEVHGGDGVSLEQGIGVVLRVGVLEHVALAHVLQHHGGGRQTGVNLLFQAGFALLNGMHQFMSQQRDAVRCGDV